jgi:hypothetical protein
MAAGTGNDEWNALSNCTTETNSANALWGQDAIKITCGSGGTTSVADLQLSSAISVDLTTAHINSLFTLIDGSGADDPSNITLIRVRLYDTSDNYSTWYVLSGADQSAAWAGYLARYTSVKASERDTSGTLNYADVDRIRVLVTTDSATDTPALYLQGLVAWPKSSIGRHCIVLDDGRSSAETLVNYAISKGVRTTMAIHDSPGISYDRLRALSDSGLVQIANHGLSDLTTDFTDKSDAQKRSEIEQQALTLAQQGLGEGYGAFAIPGGSWSPGDEVFYKKTVPVVRRSYLGLGSTLSNANLVPYGPTPWQVYAAGTADDTTNAAEIADNCITYGLLGLALFHGTEEITEANWKTYIDGVATHQAADDLVTTFLHDPWAC